MIKVDERVKIRQEQSDIALKQSENKWEIARWLAANNASMMGAKIASVYSICTFPWESPPPPPTEDILSKFPKTLN